MAYSETLFSINSKARLPLVQAFNHPLAPPTAKRTFVMFLDTSPVGMKECLGIERNLEIPFAHFNDLQAIGMYCNTFQHQFFFFFSYYPGITTLDPNDAFLAACTRINEAKLRTLLEVPKMWIIGRYDGLLTTLGMLITGESGRILLKNKRKSLTLRRRNFWELAS